jgi:uncharacterized protein
MLMRNFFMFFFFLSASFTWAQDRLFPTESAHLQGFIGQRLDSVYYHQILTQDVTKLIAPFKIRNEVRWWQTEFWGKWFTSAVLASTIKPRQS